MSTTHENIKLPAVIEDSSTLPYWQAAVSGRLLIRRCKECGEPHFYPRPLCPFCLGDTDWEESRGVGTVYSLSTVQQASGNFVIAYVELDEGVTMLTQLDNTDEKTTIGTRVRVKMREAANGLAIPVFTPEAV
ncbi:Uncharacterised protein [Xylophilus ampelinus]|nr:OB-fold domain-containing protein [Variovorax sp.]VTY30474.1 Uncharacterised protein [Xylophilus ampelinus]